MAQKCSSGPGPVPKSPWSLLECRNRRITKWKKGPQNGGQIKYYKDVEIWGQLNDERARPENEEDRIKTGQGINKLGDKI